MRFKIELPLDLTAEEIEAIIMADERTQAQLQGKTPKKVIIVPGKIINLAGFKTKADGSFKVSAHRVTNTNGGTFISTFFQFVFNYSH